MGSRAGEAKAGDGLVIPLLFPGPLIWNRLEMVRNLPFQKLV